MMNRKQKIFLGVCGGVAVLMLLFPPYIGDGAIVPGLDYDSIWRALSPSPGDAAANVTLCGPLLGFQLLFVAFVAGIGALYLMDGPRGPRRNIFHG